MYSSLEKEETGSETKVPLEHGDSEDYQYDDEEHTDNQGRKQCKVNYCEMVKFFRKLSFECFPEF